MDSRYHAAKNVFIDSIDIDDYIDLDSSRNAYDQLLHSIEKPLKMILLFGRPGTGKSILLNHLYQNKKYQKDLHYFETPTTNEKEFLGKLFKIITKKELPQHTQVNFSILVDYCRTLRGKREIIILLDEAQMYSQGMMERIRLISDTRSVKFVISLHKTEDEDLVAKEHFQSRIWEVIELQNANRKDIQTYVHKKLLKKNLFAVANAIKGNNIRLIAKLTKGNYRETNKLLFTMFELYEYYDKTDPSVINYDRCSQKIIEMAGIKLGFIDV
ncbi:MAG: ATP-binding protein [Campylobacterota bacterium]|nr:ATP-binding protein [Campylobacterota bacterium]